jgi:hypothetical protein
MTTSKANGYAQTIFGAIIAACLGILTYTFVSEKSNIKESIKEVKDQVTIIHGKVNDLQLSTGVLQTQMNQNNIDHTEIKDALKKIK